MIDYCDVSLQCPMAQAFGALSIIREILGNAQANSRWTLSSQFSGGDVVNGGVSSQDVYIEGHGITSPFLVDPLDIIVVIGYQSYVYQGTTFEGLRVKNIIPRNNNGLDIRQYNSLLGIFVQEVLMAPNIVAFVGNKWHFTSENRYCNDYLPHECAAFFERFARGANRSSAAGHPSDQAAWFDFIISVAKHLSASLPTANIILRLLVEDYGWEYYSAAQLAQEYEFGVGLMRYSYVRGA